MILKKPIITENTLSESAKGKYTFEVDRAASKTEIKRAVEKIFNLRVLKIQTSIIPGKSYRTGKRWLLRQRTDKKKAIVTVEPGKNIDLFEVTKQNQ